MRYKVLILLLAFLTISINSALCQNFRANTNDKIYWNGTKYMCSISPLSPLTGYKSVYKELPSCEIESALPIFQDKNYSAWWAIVDNKLYLFDILNICGAISSKENIEKFLNAKFSKNPLPESARKDAYFKNGVIYAEWFTGMISIKRLPKKASFMIVHIKKNHSPTFGLLKGA
ncbi:MAG: hypothetical protein LBT35_03660 [Tannerella sp.]|jgi:hypothetical protein|nr:hypothetical protein [Tannerella sp.]